MYDGDNHFPHDGKQGRCGNGEGYSWDDNDYRPDGCLELPSTLSIACRSVAKQLDGFENFPYFPCGFRIRAKIRENTYHFNI